MSLRRRFGPLLTSSLILSVAVTGALALGVSPAHAAVSGSTSAQDRTLRNTCRHVPIDYRLDVDPGTTHWQLRINVESPNDDAPEGFDLSSDQDDALQGTLRYLLCGSDAPGTYTIRGFGTYQAGLPLTNVDFEIQESTFQVRRSPTRTSATVAAAGGGRHRVVATVKALRRGEFRRVSNAPVRLQRRVDGAWRTLSRSQRLSDDGRVRYVVSLPAGTQVRAVTAAQGFRGRSTSRAVTLRG